MYLKYIFSLIQIHFPNSLNTFGYEVNISYWLKRNYILWVFIAAFMRVGNGLTFHDHSGDFWKGVRNLYYQWDSDEFKIVCKFI